MTAIAVFKYNNGPAFLLGDALLTSEISPDEKVVLPTRGLNYGNTIRINKHVVGLFQKVTVINRRLAVAWTGSFSVATKLLDDLYDRVREESNVNKRVMDEYMEHARAYMEHTHAAMGRESDCVLLGLYINDEELDCIFSVGYMNHIRKVTSPILSHCSVSGSGYNDLIELLDTDKSGTYTGGTQTPGKSAYYRSIAYVAKLLLKEIFFEDHLWDLYGGAYDLVFRSNRGYVKLTDVLFLAYSYTVETKANSIGTRIFKYDVVGSNVIIRVLNMSQDIPAEKRMEMYVLGSMVQKQSDAEKHIIEKIAKTSFMQGSEALGLPDISATTIATWICVYDGEGRSTSGYYITDGARHNKLIDVGPSSFRLTEKFNGLLVQHADIFAKDLE